MPCDTCGGTGELPLGPGDPVPCTGCYGRGEPLPAPPVEVGDTIERGGDPMTVIYVSRWYPSGEIRVKARGERVVTEEFNLPPSGGEEDA